MNNDIQKVLVNSSAPAHKSFSYLADGVKPSGLNAFLEVTLDITAGIETCLNLISSNDIARDCGDTPLISAFQSANLLRFAMAASRLLRDEALEKVGHLNESAQRQGSES
jgi:hypothetical protein